MTSEKALCNYSRSATGSVQESRGGCGQTQHVKNAIIKFAIYLKTRKRNHFTTRLKPGPRYTLSNAKLLNLVVHVGVAGILSSEAGHGRTLSHFLHSRFLQVVHSEDTILFTPATRKAAIGWMSQTILSSSWDKYDKGYLHQLPITMVTRSRNWKLQKVK